ncbi:MAG: excinuclease ABC subunit UvrC [Clostridiales Family XIII bacterium]|jgi:excinuclease ABC subunit C|nr:excinuclease ABC subunit UvrC [Clostridiales Family XIII bacterium]
MFDIREHLAELPDKPGVYLHKDEYGDVIYVGKATSLRSRVRQYFAPPQGLDAKTRALAARIAEFEYLVTDTEAEALILENTLIKRHRPRYNVMLLDDKTYPYIKITYGERYPRVQKTRTLKSDGSKYFGPYADVGALNRITQLLNDAYHLKRCSRQTFPSDWRPCLNGFIGTCDRYCLAGAEKTSPCVIPAEGEYAERIAAVVEFLKGRDHGLAADLKARMISAAERQDFEEAAKYRDLVRDAEAVTERQKVDLLSSGSMDVLLATEAEDGRMARVTLFFVRDGRLIGREIHHLDAEGGGSKKEIVAAFIKQYYANQTMIPKEILLEERLGGDGGGDEEDQAAIEDYLSEAAGHRVHILVPERGTKKKLLALAQKDIAETIKLAEDMHASKQERDRSVIAALTEVIAGDASVIAGADPQSICPPRIEAYDISHTGGQDAVGAMVVFRGTAKSKKDYRRFRIRTDEGKGGDDYAAMQEVLYRRLKRGLAGEKGFDELPDVILIDGGKGHVAAARQVLGAMQASIPVLGMVKDDHHRTRGLVDAGGAETELTAQPGLFHLIGAIQEEVHRFAIEYQRGVRGKKLAASALDGIPGIGEKRRNALFMKFGSIDAMRAAPAGELAAVPGMTRRAAETLHEYLKGV